MAPFAVALLLLAGCAREEPEPRTEIRYVPVPVQEAPAAELPEAPDPREEADARAEAVCQANDGNYFGGQCVYPGGGVDIDCDTALEQQSYLCRD